MRNSSSKQSLLQGTVTAFLLVCPIASYANVAPTVSITNPANGASFAASSNIKIEATATDSDGQVAKVEFYANTTLIGSQNRTGKTPTYFTVTWNNVANGTYALKAVAIDNKGASANSVLVNITVGTGVPNSVPSVSLTSPASGTTYTAPATVDLAATASDSDGTVSKVDFFSGTTLLGTDSTNPYSLAWNNVAAGNYSLTARATDNAGASTTSTAVSITVNAPPNTAPSVAISSPPSGTAYTAPATVSIAATAADSDGSVTGVEFFSGSSSLGSDATNPYGITWNNVAAGSYSLTARATDNAGASTTSSAVSITVNSSSSSSSSSGNCGSPSGGPTDNPIATKYGASVYSWAGNIKWSCVYNINDYAGATALDKYNAARDAAAANGGGIVYFPAGVYNFSDNLVLKNGVVIRGAVTTADARNGSNPGTLAPATKFVFPDRLHKGFYNISPTDANIGVVNIDSDGGAVMLWPALTSSNTSWDPNNIKAYWWFAQGIQGMGSNKLVYGNRIRNVSYIWPNPTSPGGNEWPWRFSTAIAVYSDQNALVANNLLDQATASSSSNVSFASNTGCTAFSGTVEYPYDNRYGIDVNRVLLGGVIGYYNSTGQANSRDLTPSTFPWQFRRGLAIRDNYIYQHGRVGIIWSGNGDGITRGSGTQVLNNHVHVAANTTLYSVDGARCAGGQSTNENRGYDQEGFASRVDGNSGFINRQRAHNTNYYSTDGEGVLHQDTNGNVGSLDFWTLNNLSGGQSGYMAYYKLASVRDCTLTQNTVNASEYIGIVLHASGTSTSGNDCSNNSEPCTNM